MGCFPWEYLRSKINKWTQNVWFCIYSDILILYMSEYIKIYWCNRLKVYFDKNIMCFAVVNTWDVDMSPHVYWSVISAHFAQVQVPFVQLCVQEKSQLSDFTRMASASQVHLNQNTKSMPMSLNRTSIFSYWLSRNFTSHCFALVWNMT